MQASSPSLSSLATALAKAQAKLKNPEKTLTASIMGVDRKAHLFRYASLASGLEIIRRTLSEYEIAVVQSTAVDSQLQTI